GNIQDKDFLLISAWVDDLNTLSNKSYEEGYNRFMKELKNRFDVKELGEPARHIGFNIVRDWQQGKITVHHEDAIEDKYLERTKHEVVKIEYIRNLIKDGMLKAVKVDTADNTADIMIKALAKNLLANIAKA
ncbi:UNVERIFIED_CONTAM: hypothetical protein HDU68_005215, partial [Siphonaria sp. JEL0065]